MIIINGKVEKPNNNKEKVEKFINRWEQKIEEIKKLSLDKNHCYWLNKDFINETFHYIGGDLDIEDRIGLLFQLYHDLHLALASAFGNYRKENRTFWNLFWQDKLKLPPVNFNFLNNQLHNPLNSSTIQIIPRVSNPQYSNKSSLILLT